MAQETKETTLTIEHEVEALVGKWSDDGVDGGNMRWAAEAIVSLVKKCMNDKLTSLAKFYNDNGSVDFPGDDVADTLKSHLETP
jgi:hypothetical protein